MARRRTTTLRAEAAKRAGGYCEYCRSPERFSPATFSIDHILPTSRGGPDELSNLAFACQGCNNAKYNRTTGRDPVTGAEVALFNPRKDSWADHFRWSNTFRRIVGITATGRATVELIRLNRQQLQELRKLLRTAGLHPPRS